MSSYQILYVEINLISLVLTLMLFIKSRDLKQVKAHPQFIYATALTSAFILSDLFCFLSTGGILFAYPAFILFAKSCYFLSTAVIGYYWLLYFEYKGNTSIARSKKLQMLLYSLIIIQFIMTLLNVRYGFFFRMDEQGVYQRGILFSVQYMFCYFYIGVAIARALYSALLRSNYVDKTYVATLALFPILPAFSGIIQFFRPDLPVTCICLPLAALLLYMNDVNDLIFVDPLTGLNNRRNFMHILSRKMRSYDEALPLYLLMLDVDYFKTINDTYGHTEGDHALTTIAGALTLANASLKKKASIGRFGGDEFIILLEADQEEVLLAFMNQIQQLLEKQQHADHSPYKISVSIGYAKYNPSYRMVKDFIDAADERLYQIKAARHGK